jgi:hypothetical protein
MKIYKLAFFSGNKMILLMRKKFKNKIAVLWLLMLLTVSFDFSAEAQTKTENLEWLRAHLQTIITHSDDSLLAFTKTKTYTFYDDAFVVKTQSDFEDKSINGPPYFAKVWYADIIPEDEHAIARAIQVQQPDSMCIFSMKTSVLYTTAVTEKKSKELWYTFNEPMEIELFLPKDKKLSMELINRMMQLAKNDE